MGKKVISFFIVASILGCSYSVRAAPIQNDTSKQITVLEDQMEITDSNIENTLISVSKNTNDINKINVDIKAINQEIIDKKIILEKDNLINKNTMKAIYESGGSNTILINTLLESKDFSDIISNVTAINQVLDANKKIISKVSEDEKYIEKKQNKLFKNKNKLRKLLKDNTDKLDKLKNDKSKQTEALNKLKDLKLSDSIPINEYQQSVSLGHLIYGDDSVATYAKNFLGIPYLWGGTSPSGFDCSGFVQYIYAHFGINLPRTTYEQVNVGTTVTGDLKPGDLIFFGDKSKPHHVGMYIGENQYIQAPHTGDFVKISSIKGCDYSIAKRIN